VSESLIESVELVEVKRVPSFIFTTHSPERLQRLFRLFPLTILTLDVATWSQMPLPPNVVIPDDAALRIEFSLDDVQSGQLLWEMYISGKQRAKMANFNLQSKTLNIGIRNLTSGKIIPVPGKQVPYVLDWSGTGGLVYTIRNTNQLYGRGWEKKKAYQIIVGIEEQIDKHGGYVTALHAHMGLVYRDLGEFGKAKRCYLQEIRGAQRSDGTFGQSAMLGFNNLAVIYKKEQAFKEALQNFRFALALHPNYFQALVSVAGLITDINESIVYLGRAFHIQSENPIWNTIITNMASAYEQPPQAIYDRIYAAAEQANLEKPLIKLDILKEFHLE